MQSIYPGYQRCADAEMGQTVHAENRDAKELSVQMHDALFQLLQGVSEQQALILSIL